MTSSWSIEWGLALLFLIHFVAFAALAWRRRTWQFAPAMVTFAVLVALNLLKAMAVGGDGLHDALRGSAYLGLSLSVALWARRKWLNP
jgi:hypothetical protein